MLAAGLAAFAKMFTVLLTFLRADHLHISFPTIDMTEGFAASSTSANCSARPRPGVF